MIAPGHPNSVRPYVVERRTMMSGMAAQAVAAVASKLPMTVYAEHSSDLFDNSDRWEPFELVTDDAIYVAAELNGRAVQAVLDSGSGATIIATALATELGLRGEGRTIAGPASKASVSLVRGVTVTLSGTTRTLPFALIGDLSAISDAMGRPVDLVLGADVFTERCIAIDFVRRRLSVSPTGSFDGGVDWVASPLFRGNRKELLTNVSLGGAPSVPMMIDTGGSIALLMSEPYLQHAGLGQGRPFSTTLMAGLDGVHVARLLTIDGLTLGGLRIDAIPSVGMPRWMSTSSVGNIGLPILAQFNVVFDISRARLWLRPLRPTQRLPMLKDRSGLGIRLMPSGVVVVHISANSPAAAAGWVNGTTIVAINGRKVDDRYTRGELWRWRYGLPGRTVRLTLDTGETRSLRLQTFY